MNLDRFFSTKDFFNYYAAGLTWSLTLTLAVSLLAGGPLTLAPALAFPELTDASRAFIVIVLVIVGPYVLGFLLTSPCYEVTSQLRRSGCGDPISWVVGLPCAKPIGFFGRIRGGLAQAAVGSLTQIALPSASLTQLEKRINDDFGLQLRSSDSDASSAFQQVRVYLSARPSELSQMADRAGDLSRLAESLIIPLPLLGFSYTFLVLHEIIPLRPVVMQWTGAFLLALGVGFVIGGRLGKRYLELRQYWALHTFRAYLSSSFNERPEKP
jgi:hypothetical protein